MIIIASFAPLLHAGGVTWDELLLLVVGLALIIIVAYLGQRSEQTPQRLISTVIDDRDSRPRLALSIRDVTQRYGARWALAKTSLEVSAGHCLSILGPNGAGKSTLLHILATLIMPTAGDVVIGETSLQQNPAALRRHVGLVAHKPLLYPHLTVMENLSFFGRLYSVSDWPQQAERLLKQVRLWSKRDELVRSLSQGQKQRVAIARALLHNPDILLLDEPYAGLDLKAAELLDNLLDELKTIGHTLLITTHDLQRSFTRSDQLVILADGRIVYQAQSQDITLDTLQTTYQHILTHFAEENDD